MEPLEGKLVRLRAVEPADTERAYKWINDYDVTQHLMVRYPISLEWEKSWIQEAAAKANSFEDCRFAIDTRDGVHVGFTGLHRGRPEDRNAELGIFVGDKSFWSRGYGTDAVRVVLRFAFRFMNLHKVTLGVFAPNERAQACYRKCGFVEEGRFREDYYQDGCYWDIIRMSILRREFDSPPPAAG